MDKKTIAEVLYLVNETTTLIALANIKRRKKRWISHILRHDNWRRTVFDGRLEGKRPRRKKRILLMDDIKNG